MTIYVAQGPTVKKVVLNKASSFMPFAGVKVQGEQHRFGIGYFSSQSAFTPVFPYDLIRAWRALKLLEAAPEIEANTLQACWYAVGTRLTSSELSNVEDLAALFPSQREFNELQASIMASSPTDEEVTAMLGTLRAADIQVRSDSLMALVEARRLKPNSLIDELVTLEAAQRVTEEQASEARRKWRAFVDEPVAPELSLGQFLHDLGVNNLLHMSGEGPMRLKHEEYDLHVKSLTTGPNRGHIPLVHDVSEQPPHHKLDVQHPRLQAPDGAIYRFVNTRFMQDQFEIEVTITAPGIDPVTRAMTVSELRADALVYNKALAKVSRRGYLAQRKRNMEFSPQEQAPEEENKDEAS